MNTLAQEDGGQESNCSHYETSAVILQKEEAKDGADFSPENI